MDSGSLSQGAAFWRRWRETAGLTWEEVASITGIRRSTLRRIESGGARATDEQQRSLRALYGAHAARPGPGEPAPTTPA